MELGVRQFRWHEQIYGIPWNLKCANFADTRSSMEFHGNWRAPISLTREVLWNSIEFHATTSAPISLTRAVPWNSMELRMRQLRWHQQFHGMEFHGTCGESIRWHEQLHGIPWNSIEFEVPQFRWHEQFHGIPLNLECPNFADTSSSMEFHGTKNALVTLTPAVPLHGIPWNLRWVNSLTRAAPWNSMEFHRIWSAPISVT